MIKNISIIGYKNQASKLLLLLKQKKYNVKWIYHPSKKISEKSTNKLSDLFESDVIIIASPNDTHYHYIKRLLKNFSGYIFCEKPPVTTIEDLLELDKISEEDKKRIFFNFNLRFSEINHQIKNQLKEKNLGKLIHINIISSKGIAFKDEYLESWRSDGSKNLHNILDAITIHFIDLFNYHLGKIIDYNYQPNLFSTNGTSFDTINLNLKYENNVTVSILNSYAAPLYNEISIIGTNGILLIKNDELQLFSPRDTFDKNGFFIMPPKLESQSFNFNQEFQKSTEKSLDYFLNKVDKNEPIDLQYFKLSVRTTNAILEIKSKYTKDF